MTTVGRHFRPGLPPSLKRKRDDDNDNDRDLEPVEKKQKVQVPSLQFLCDQRLSECLTKSDNVIETCTAMARTIPSDVAVGTMLHVVQKCKEELGKAQRQLEIATHDCAVLQLHCKKLEFSRKRSKMAATEIYTHSEELLKRLRENRADYDELKPADAIQQLAASL